MSVSLLHRAFGIRRNKYAHTEYENGQVIFTNRSRANPLWYRPWPPSPLPSFSPSHRPCTVGDNFSGMAPARRRRPR